ncbi:MAG: 16S rRNA (cytosine(1402)-N(4))-methyltransferase RsmH [Planctomycetes bacterium]|nr:16S rRNA (cytosine(1402)-N(4))-methyltransferase RsmH [Planctomycetota bacterium]
MTTGHIPVMLEETIHYLRPRPGEIFIDCTLGGGGYTLALAARIGPSGRVLAIEWDESAISRFKKNAGNLLSRVVLVHDNYKKIDKIINEHGPVPLGEFAGIVFDLGLSTDQLEDKDRGFSFQLAAPLDMRFSRAGSDGSQTTAAEIINNFAPAPLEDLIKRYGEERYARPIVRAITAARSTAPIRQSDQLAAIIAAAVPRHLWRGKIHPATRTFQALRLAVNQELANLETALPRAINLLKPGGRMVVISYHSLEDRLVKNIFKTESRDCLCPPYFPVCRCHHQAALKIITKKPRRPSPAEVEANPRARSAKLRAAEKIG